MRTKLNTLEVFCSMVHGKQNLRRDTMKLDSLVERNRLNPDLFKMEESETSLKLCLVFQL
jgi:hypothetical protein